MVTDLHPLLGTFRKPLAEIENPRLQRIREKTAGYNFNLEWIEGKSHLIADALSRYPVKEGGGAHVIASLNCINSDLLKFAQQCADNEQFRQLLEL